MSHDVSVSAMKQRFPAGGAVACAAKENSVARLAQFFPTATPVRLSVCVSAGAAREQTVIEYGTASEVLFGSNLPLEFGQCVRLSNADRSLDAEAEVVAVQFEGARIAVAARFVRQVTNWIVQP